MTSFGPPKQSVLLHTFVTSDKSMSHHGLSGNRTNYECNRPIRQQQTESLIQNKNRAEINQLGFIFYLALAGQAILFPISEKVFKNTELCHSLIKLCSDSTNKLFSFERCSLTALPKTNKVLGHLATFNSVK